MAMNVVIDMLKSRNSAIRVNNGEWCKRHTAGFTMAEMLIVVAIIGVLAAVSFIAVQAHQKFMTQLQYDAIAKEIFVAAQNHLTLAKSENYQQKSDLSTAITSGFFGTKGNADADTNDDIFYFDSTSSNAGTALDQILPLGAVELVTGGKYIIRYQPNAAQVLDVFYWTDENKYGISSMNYGTAVSSYRGTEKKSERAKIGGNGVLGWCGGEDIVESGEYLEAPVIDVINAEMLLVTVTNPNTDKSELVPKMKLIVTGIQSKAKIAIPLESKTSFLDLSTGERVVYDTVDKVFTVVLDDITTEGLHFSELQNEKKKPTGTREIGTFIPGENITIQAVAFSNDFLTGVAYSGEWTTNSLFNEVTEDETGKKTTKISNIRHLANLNDGLSGLNYSNSYFNNTINAVQTTNLYWNDEDDGTDDFVSAIKTRKSSESVSIYSNTNATKADCFLPVSVNYTLNYNGQSDVKITETSGTGESATTTTKTFTENHSIKGVVVDNTGDAPGTATVAPGGVFGSLTGGEIKNLELIDTKVTLASGNAGALAGTLSGTTITNVVAHNTSDFETELAKTDETKTTVYTKASGAAGGLIGSATNCTIQKSAAALIVKSEGGNAGGLIGTAEGGTVSGCYAGGHAIDKMNGTGTGAEVIGVTYDSDKYNVTASGVAGGLIGDAGAAEISYSYSTCSATGATVGGLIGTGSGAITSSYCTGKVSGTTQGAFAGACGTTTDCHYYEIVNEYTDADGGYDYLLPVPKEKTSDGTGKPSGIKAIDETAQSYNEFCGAAKDSQGKDLWNPANPYDAKLTEYYNGRYNLETVEQLGASITKNSGADGDTTVTDFVATHYGDWPVPEIFVVNTKGTNATPATPTP